MGPAQLLVLALPAGLIVAAYRCWDLLLASFTTQQLIVWGLWLLVCGTYWGFGGLFHLVDRSGRPEALSRAKLQPRRAPEGEVCCVSIAPRPCPASSDPPPKKVRQVTQKSLAK